MSPHHLTHVTMANVLYPPLHHLQS